MNTAQVAEMLNRPSIKAVQILVRKERLPAHRLPRARRYWFLRDEIIACLQSVETKGNPQ